MLAPARRTRYLLALLASLVSATALFLFPGFFGSAPFFPATAAALLSLLLLGVGPALLTQVTALAATVLLLVVAGSPLEPAGTGAAQRITLLVVLFALADGLAWRLERIRRKAVEREGALQESETRYRHVLEQASDGIVLAHPKGHFVLVNPRICEILGYTEEEMLALPLAGVYAPGELEGAPLRWEELMQTSVVVRERRLRRKDGSTFLAELSVRLTPEGLAHAIVRDITERRRAEEALRAEHDLLDGILATSVAGILVVTPEGRVIFLNPRAEAVLGVTRDQLGKRTSLPPGWRFLTLEGTPLPDADRPVRRVVETGEAVQDARLIVERPPGDRSILSVNAAPLRDAAHQITAVVLSIDDITEEYCGQLALHEREEQIQRITSAVPGVVYQYVVEAGTEGRFAFVSERAQDLLGVSAEDILGDPERAGAMIDPEDREAMAAAFRRASETLEPMTFDFRVRGPNDQVRWLRDIATAVQARDPDRVIWNGVIVDITERKRLEQELQQSQKMDSLGRLAGGVAHDFNNLLTVIRGYADVLSGELSEGDPRLTEVREIRRAADRATSLTRQLLAVSRRQVLVPREVDLNALVVDMERMLRRVIGEGVSIVTVRAPSLGSVRADPGQLEQVLLNLAVNARDAMPAGGVLTIETSRMVLVAAREDAAARGVPPGDYVVLRVADTGMGMDRETQSKIFDPFFTTKPVGEGTGLGLSTVYGIVQQSRGVITVESEPALGTSFRIFLPRIAATRRPSREAIPDRLEIPAPRRRANILLVEDDDGVRQLTLRILEQFGFGVVEAENGVEALALLDTGAIAVDAVVSDVVMPGINGRELIRRLRTQRPELPVLFLSGYTGEEVSEEVQAHPRQGFLQKPFSPDALAAALEELLADTGDPSLRSG